MMLCAIWCSLKDPDGVSENAGTHRPPDFRDTGRSMERVKGASDENDRSRPLNAVMGNPSFFNSNWRIGDREEKEGYPPFTVMGAGLADRGEYLLHRHLRADLTAELDEEDRQALGRHLAELEKSGPGERRWVCWSPGTEPSILTAYLEAEKSLLSRPGYQTQANQFLNNPHWFRTATNGSFNATQGLPVTVTWSIVPDGTPAPDGAGGAAVGSNLRTWLTGIYGGSAASDPTLQPWFPVLEAAFADVAAECGLKFVYEASDDGVALAGGNTGSLGIRGDIRLSARLIDGDYGTLAFAYEPDFGDVVIDSGDVFLRATFSDSIRLHNTLTHEIGHAVGLGHVCPINSTKLMEPNITTSFRGPQYDESFSLQRQYGDLPEYHSTARNNDTAGNATELSPATGVALERGWLSIDDSTDIDYFRFTAAADQLLSVTITPSDPVNGPYLEGPQNEDGSCSGGTPFDPINRHDLTLELLASNGSTVLASSTGGGPGEAESLSGFALTAGGTYYLRINGGASDTAQLYHLSLLVRDPAPVPNMVLVSHGIEAESGVPANGLADPGETLRYRVEFENAGNLATGAITASLGGTGGITWFTDNLALAPLAPNGQTTGDFVFALTGDCGDEFSFVLQVADDQGYHASFSFDIVLGQEMLITGFTENFDSSGALPAGWSSSTTGGGAPWTISTSRTDTAPNAAFSPGVSSTGDAFLLSPPIDLGASPEVLTFRHWYDLVGRTDGAILEASLGGGTWFDLLNSEATVTSGNYNANIRSSSTASLAGRSVWSGNSGGFVTTSLNLPKAWAGQMLRLRWYLSHDRNRSRAGWHLDSVVMTETILQCQPHRPEIELVPVDVELAEGESSPAQVFALTSSLPLAVAVNIPLQFSGTASLNDHTLSSSLLLPAGEVSEGITFDVPRDSLVEGIETLTVNLPVNDAAFSAGPSASATISLKDSPYGTWAAAKFGAGAAAASPERDGDRDGWSNVAEYVYDTDPQDVSSRPQSTVSGDGKHLKIVTSIPVERADVVLSAEVTSDLETWSADGVTPIEHGFQVPESGDHLFLRLKLSFVDP